MFIAASGMKAQGARLKVIAENMANANSTADRTGGDPYRRQLVLFRNVLDRNLNAELVEVRRVEKDMSDFRLEYDPNHPAANQDGFVEMPNVNPLVEMMDLREAQRSYEANLNMIDVTRAMLPRNIDTTR